MPPLLAQFHSLCLTVCRSGQCGTRFRAKSWLRQSVGPSMVQHANGSSAPSVSAVGSITILCIKNLCVECHAPGLVANGTAAVLTRGLGTVTVAVKPRGWSLVRHKANLEMT